MTDVKYKFGFIGCGNMGSALAMSIARSTRGSTVALCDTDYGKAQSLAERVGGVALELSSLVLSAEYIFIAVKPQGLEELCNTIRPILGKRADTPVFITMAAGTPISKLESFLDKDYPIIRIMPNTPVSCGKGVILYCKSSLVTDEHIEVFKSALNSAGLLAYIDEDKFDSESIITGCGPAYVFEFINAMARAAENLGVSPENALLYAKNTVFGAAALAMESDEEPLELCRRVCSPGGSTIEGIKLMRDRELTKILSDAAAASYNRTLEMKKL